MNLVAGARNHLDLQLGELLVTVFALDLIPAAAGRA
jgi:hypothetical protein